MPPALSPSGRVRSRTSDISDFLRGRHDAKISSDLPPPPVPLLPDPVTPPKHKSKFGFLGRKRKPSFSPSSAKTSAAVAATAAAAIATSSGGNNVHPTDHVHGGTQPSPAGPSGRTPSRDLPPLPPLDVIAPGYKPRSDPTRNSGVLSPTKGQYASPSSVLHNIRKQKGSFESSRRSTDSRSSMRPIITVSPPHNTMHETADAYTAPRSAPSPAPPSPLRPNECSLPTPTASDMSDRTATPETPTSAEIPSPSTSTHSVAQYPPISPSDPPLATATSYKEESLLRQDHFEINESASTPRRGTVSFNSSNPTPPATVGFSPSRQERRHISVLQLNRLKKEITATAPKIRKMPSDPKSLATPTSNVSLSRSNTIAASPPHTPHSPQGSRSPTPQQQRRIPPPLKRTWHSPPSTGPPKEPLPSPPASAAARSAQTPTTADSFRTARSPSSSPVSPHRTLPPLVLARETAHTRAAGAKSPDSLASTSIPPSPSRTISDVETDREAPSIIIRTGTPLREDPTVQVLGDPHATAEQLREALRRQHEKYTRLSSYLLSLTERHALERAELMRKVEVLEASGARYEREMKGLRWLVAHGAKDSKHDPRGPPRADSSTLPQPRKTSVSMSMRDRSASVRSVGGGSVRSLGTSDGTRMSFDSPAGSVEEGLVELQTTISEFIAPVGGASPNQQQQQQQQSVVPASNANLKTRPRRANTVPNPSSPGIPQVGSAAAGGSQVMIANASRAQLQVGPSSSSSALMAKQKAARRTSSPVIPSPSSSSAGAAALSSTSSVSSSVKRPAASRTGLGLGLSVSSASSDGPVSMSPPFSPPLSSPLSSFSRSPSPGADSQSSRDAHARSDSSTLSSLPSLSTIHSSSSSAGSPGLSSIPETPRDDRFGFAGARRMSTSSTSTSGSAAGSGVGMGSGVGAGAGKRVSASPSIGQVLDRTRARAGSGGGGGGGGERVGSGGGVKTGTGTGSQYQHQHQQPEMDEILRKLRAFGLGVGRVEG